MCEKFFFLFFLLKISLTECLAQFDYNPVTILSSSTPYGNLFNFSPALTTIKSPSSSTDKMDNSTVILETNLDSLTSNSTSLNDTDYYDLNNNGTMNETFTQIIYSHSPFWKILERINDNIYLSIIVPIVTGIILAIMFLCVICCCNRFLIRYCPCCRRKRRRNKMEKRIKGLEDNHYLLVSNQSDSE